jgi:hypothetical protein
MRTRYAGLLAALVLLGSCAPLTARSPLFSAADAIGPVPLSEGLWIQAGEECVPDARSEWADDCVSIEVSRGRDGVWLYTSRSTGSDGEAEQYSWRFVIVSAVETAREGGYAPLYVAEYVSVDEPGRPLYAVVVPVGPMPAREVRMVGVIDCDDALREGPIPGVEEFHADDDFVRICVAGARAAVREAARRALIENLGVLLGEPRARFVWISPLHEPAPQILVEAR